MASTHAVALTFTADMGSALREMKVLDSRLRDLEKASRQLFQEGYDTAAIEQQIAALRRQRKELLENSDVVKELTKTQKLFRNAISGEGNAEGFQGPMLKSFTLFGHKVKEALESVKHLDDEIRHLSQTAKMLGDQGFDTTNINRHITALQEEKAQTLAASGAVRQLSLAERVRIAQVEAVLDLDREIAQNRQNMAVRTQQAAVATQLFDFSARNMTQATTQATYAAEDFITMWSIMGNPAAGMRGAANNLGMMARILMPGAPLMAGMVGIGAAIVPLISYFNSLEEEVDKSVMSFDGLAAVLAEMAMSASGRALKLNFRLQDIAAIEDLKQLENEFKELQRTIKELGADSDEALQRAVNANKGAVSSVGSVIESNFKGITAAIKRADPQVDAALESELAGLRDNFMNMLKIDPSQADVLATELGDQIKEAYRMAADKAGVVLDRVNPTTGQRELTAAGRDLENSSNLTRDALRAMVEEGSEFNKRLEEAVDKEAEFRKILGEIAEKQKEELEFAQRRIDLRHKEIELTREILASAGDNQADAILRRTRNELERLEEEFSKTMGSPEDIALMMRAEEHLLKGAQEDLKALLGDAEKYQDQQIRESTRGDSAAAAARLAEEQIREAANRTQEIPRSDLLNALKKIDQTLNDPSRPAIVL